MLNNVKIRRRNGSNAMQANALSLSAAEVAGKGGAVVSQVVTTMGSINASASEIVAIIDVIEGIAFQTNILALNAAVEAARAGDQGRGFAVAASEVRNLAQRSARAAREIKSLIDHSVAQVTVGTWLVDQAGKTMDDIVSSVNKVTAIVAEISTAGREQMAEAWEAQEKLGFPAIIRPSFTMGGSGGGIAYNFDQFLAICTRAGAVAHLRTADRGVADRLERVRDGGGARQARQLHHPVGVAPLHLPGAAA